MSVKRVMVPLESLCLLVQPRDGLTLDVFSVPASLITDQVREAFNDGWTPQDFLLFDDIEPYPEEISPDLVLLFGRIKILGIGLTPDTLLKYNISQVLTVAPLNHF